MCNAQFVVQMSMELETFYRKPLEEHPYLIKPLLDNEYVNEGFKSV